MTTSRDTRLCLSAERTSSASRYDLTLHEDDTSKVVGTIRPLQDGRWDWMVALGSEPELRRLGQASTAEEASEMQFDALCEIDPTKFQRLAA